MSSTWLGDLDLNLTFSRRAGFFAELKESGKMLSVRVIDVEKTGQSIITCLFYDGCVGNVVSVGCDF